MKHELIPASVVQIHAVEVGGSDDDLGVGVFCEPLVEVGCCWGLMGWACSRVCMKREVIDVVHGGPHKPRSSLSELGTICFLVQTPKQVKRWLCCIFGTVDIYFLFTFFLDETTVPETLKCVEYKPVFFFLSKACLTKIYKYHDLHVHKKVTKW